MADGLGERYRDLVDGSYDCVDRIVLDAYFGMGHSPGGFRCWWRRLHGDDESELDNAHLMRMAGRFSRRLRAFAQANGIPVIDCKRGERKHLIAEEYLAKNRVGFGVFLILIARAPAPVWEVERSTSGRIRNLKKKVAYVNHYSFHIVDPQWGHLTIKMSGHPPFPAQIMLNGHEYVARQAEAAGIGFAKEGNCFTRVTDAASLAQIADTLSQPATTGRLTEVCERWIYSAACFALDRDEQVRSGFYYSYFTYQVEYSRNFLFRVGAQMDKVFERMVDRTRSRLDMPVLRTLFGAKTRPHYDRASGPPTLEAAIEKPRYGLTWFKVQFGLLQLKAYTKGERVLRLEATVHNARQLGCGRSLEKFPAIAERLGGMVERFATALDCVDVGFIGDDQVLDQLPLPAQLGKARIGGIDLNKPRMRGAVGAALALAVAPDGFAVADFATKVRALTGQPAADYTVRQAAYDLRKLRAKGLIVKPARSHRYRVEPVGARTMSALLTLRDHVIVPIMAGVRSPRMGRKPAVWTAVDRHYETLRIGMQALFHDLGIATAA